MKKRLLTPLIASLFIVAPTGCKDDDSGGDATDSANVTDPGPTSSTTDMGTTAGMTTVTPTTTGPDETTMVDLSTTGEPTTTGTTGEPVGCNAPADNDDEDADGIVNSADNCRCDANPNQLDFDGNSVGNVCDAPLAFKIADGVPPEFNRLDTTATAESGLQCEFPVSLIVLGGDVQVKLDDVGKAQIFASKLTFADTPELTCNLVVVTVKLKIQDLVSDGDSDAAFTVGFPFSPVDHAAGTVTGATDIPHAIFISGVINVTESSAPNLAMPGESPIMMIPGALPTALASVTTGGQVSMAFDDTNSTVFMHTTMSGIKIKLTGLKGTLRLKK